MSEVLYILSSAGLLAPLQSLLTGLVVIGLVLYILKRTA